LTADNADFADSDLRPRHAGRDNTGLQSAGNGKKNEL
jgi:hypothetical protein